MILEVNDQGRIERIAVAGSEHDKEIDGRRFIGGYRANTGGYEEIWFDKAVWDVTMIAENEYFKTYQLIRKAS